MVTSFWCTSQEERRRREETIKCPVFNWRRVASGTACRPGLEGGFVLGRR